jgi:acetyltransferase-like isoleucine patch superfamily enzyme
MIYGMDVSPSARVSFRSYLDKTHPKGIHIGEESYITSGAMILSHDYINDLKLNTRIGRRCFIGANAIIMPGVTIGDSVIVGAGAIVIKDIPSGSIVAGNPARIIHNDIKTNKFGQLVK